MSSRRDVIEAYDPWAEPEEPARGRWWPTVTAAALMIAVNVFAISQAWPPFIGAAMGFWFILLQPVYLIATTALLDGHSVAERIGYSLGAVLLILMLAGLAVNFVLPLVTALPPLSPIPVVVLGDVLNIALYFFHRRYPAVILWREHFRAIRPEEIRLAAISLSGVGLAVLGANRLNNGAGDQLTIAAIGIALLVIILQLRWLKVLRDDLIGVSIYLMSFALLLTTSLRGWLITGHDIQDEYRVFQLTALHGHWSMTYWHDAYNACLSITILPTMLSRVVGVSHPYIFKFLFQAIFAFCPVLVYAIVRRYWVKPVAILAVAYFVGFPTFFNDMPFLNRQEIGYLFVCIAVLAATNTRWSLRTRQLALLAAGIGVEISHYSTMYVLLGALTIGWLARHAFGFLSRLFTRTRAEGPSPEWAAGAARTTTATMIVVLGLVFFLWGNVATQTSGQVMTTAKSVVSALVEGRGTGGPGSGYSILTRRVFNPQKALQDYRRSSLDKRSTEPSGEFLPLTAVSSASTPVVKQGKRPLTAAGRVLAAIGLPVAAANTAMRDLTAYAEQLFVGIGLFAFLFTARLRRIIGEELFWLALGSTAMVALITVLPGASADYGPLRAYQQGLITMAPVLVVGTGKFLRWFTRRSIPVAAVAVICLGFFVTTTSLLSQLTGGNIAELNLNNSGLYYDIYYTRPQEEKAVSWLSRQPDVLGLGVQASYRQSRFEFANAGAADPQNVEGGQVVGDFYPTLVRRSSWVIADYTVIRTGVAATRVTGHIIQYKYPIGLLQSNKDLVYSNGSTEIYK